MNMKAILFAGSGLFVSMVATTMWISHDMAQIRERERAKQLAECAAPATQPVGGTVAATQDPGMAAAPPAAAPAGTTAPPEAACTSTPTPAAAGSDGAIDPSTGLPIDGAGAGTTTDPSSAASTVDPAMMDPASGTSGQAPITTDPAAAPIGTDPAYGADMGTAPVDPAAAPAAAPIGF